MSGTFVGMPAFPERPGPRWPTHCGTTAATHTIRDKRAGGRRGPGVGGAAAHRCAIKEATLRDLERHLVDLEASLQARGAVVHWANDAAEANEIVARITKDHGPTRS